MSCRNPSKVLQKRRPWAFLCFSALIVGGLFGQNLTTQIRTFSIEEGLSSHNISCVAQDKIGYLWVGTDDGLNRFDGSKFRVFRNDPNDSLSISDTRVTAIFATQFHGKPELWIGTRNGLNHLNLKTGEFTRYLHDPLQATSLSHPIVTSITGQDNGNIWVGSENGISILRPESRVAGTFLRVYFESDREDLGDVNFIRKIITGHSTLNEDKIWVGTRGGLKSITFIEGDQPVFSSYALPDKQMEVNGVDFRALFLSNRKSDSYLLAGTELGDLYTVSALNRNAVPKKLWSFDTYIRDIYVDAVNHIWVATYGGGLFRFSVSDDSFSLVTSYQGHPELKNSLSNSHTSDLALDNAGILWVATDNGLNAVLDPVQGFSTMTHIPGNQNSLAGSGIRSVYEDSYGVLWVGTVASGLTRINRATGEYKHYISQPEDAGSLGSNSITSILRDRFGVMWIGSWEGGLSRLNPDGNTFTRFTHDPNNVQSLPDNVVQGILEDREGRLWLNTGNGLSRYIPETQSFVNYFHDPEDSTSITTGELQSKAMYLDRKNRLWLGSYGGGVSRLDLKIEENLDPKTAVFQQFTHDPLNPQSIGSNLAISISGTIEKNVDVIWIGSFNSGLTRLESRFRDGDEEYSYKHFTESDGLCDNVIFGIEVDNREDLWLSTGEGLSRFDPELEHFTNYFMEDGLPANGFFWGASNKSHTGEMFFGGTDGLVHFFPDGITGRYIFAPQITISGVELMNKQLTDRPRDYNGADLYFDHTENIFTLEWALFDFIKPAKNRFEYQLEGFQDHWVSAENKNSVTFSNLPGGQYTFRVRGSNYNGVKSIQEATVQVNIKPPFWDTLIFRVAIILSIIIGLSLLVRIRTKAIARRNKKLRESNEALSILVKERENAEDALRRTLDEKDVLLREIYHRTKNNMSVIISLLNLQAAGIDKPELTEMFDEIKGRIYAMSLVHEQLMRTKDLSVIDFREYVVQLISNLIYSYSAVGARISKWIKIDSVQVSIDTAVPLGLVINEIITNSLKYAFPGDREGEISVIAQFRHNKLFIRISDDGVGFSPLDEVAQKKSLGTRIIHTVVEDQLDGELKLNSEDGTVYEIVLKDIEIVRRV